MHPLLIQLIHGDDLSAEQSGSLFAAIIRGEVEPLLLSALLTALKIKGEAPGELAGAVCALLKTAKPFPRPDYPFCDIVGTGGDGLNTFNISTTSALVAASCGIKVAKHGNRSASSQSGSSDLLEQLGIPLALEPAKARKMLDEINFCFLFAPHYHQGFQHATTVRKALKIPTIFNLLGPLLNPARPSFQMLGVYRPELIPTVAEALRDLGMERAMVVHGSGCDEIAIHGPTQCAEITHNTIHYRTLTPDDFGVKTYPLAAISGGDPAYNRDITENLLAGKGTPAQRTAVAVNVAPLLVMGGFANDLKEASTIALNQLSSGAPLSVLQQIQERHYV